MPILNRLPMTKRIQSVLDEAMGSGFPVGLGQVPKVDEQTPGAPDRSKILAAAPYAILYPLWVEARGGPSFSGPDDDPTWVYQVTCVALRVDQLEVMRDKVQQVFLARTPGGFAYPFDVEGMSNMDRRAGADTGLPEVDAQPIYSDMQFSVMVTPA